MSFRAPLIRSLRDLGLAGKAVVVSLGETGIELAGEEAGRLSLPFAEIERLRFGFDESQYGTVPMLRLWRHGGDGPLVLVGSIDRAAYGRFVRDAVVRLRAARPDLPIQTGSGLFVPVFTMGSFGLLALAAAGLSAWLAHRGEAWTMPMGALAVAAVLLAILGPWTLARHAPRRVLNVEDVERALPGC